MSNPEYVVEHHAIENREAWEFPIVENLTKFHVAAWLLHIPGAHAFWSHWDVQVVHLRDDVPGAAKAHKTDPRNTHELSVRAINPDKCPKPDPKLFKEGYPHLTPADVLVQFHVPSDAQAKRLCDMLVHEVLLGRLSPDQDHRSLWNELVRVLAQKAREAQ